MIYGGGAEVVLRQGWFFGGRAARFTNDGQRVFVSALTVAWRRRRSEWATVPDAIGQEPGSVGTAFDETDLGGTTFRVKVVIGL